MMLIQYLKQSQSSATLETGSTKPLKKVLVHKTLSTFMCRMHTTFWSRSTYFFVYAFIKYL